MAHGRKFSGCKGEMASANAEQGFTVILMQKENYVLGALVTGIGRLVGENS